MLADQFAHVECDAAVVFDSAFAFRTATHWARQLLAGDRAMSAELKALAENRQRSTMPTPQGFDATHSDELFPVKRWYIGRN